MPSTETSMIDGLSTSVAVKAPCVDVETSNITLSGLQGYTENDRVLVVGQTDPVENGVYSASSGSWTRTLDADGNRDLVKGTRVLVQSGGDGIGYELVSDDPIVIGTSELVFELREIDSSLRADLATASVAGDDGAQIVGFKLNKTGSVARTVRGKLSEAISLWDFTGFDETGGTNSSVAFAAAWAALKSNGGKLIIPRGNYLLASQWDIDVDQVSPYSYEIDCQGSVFHAAAAVTGHAIRIYKGYNNFGIEFKNAVFNHRNNTTVGGCISAQGAANLRLHRITMEGHNTKAGYSVVELTHHTPADHDSNTYWTIIDQLTTRQRSGGDGTNMAIGVHLKGNANATSIFNSSFNNCTDALRFSAGSVDAAMSNGSKIFFNNFEGVTNCITIDEASPATHTPPMKVGFNRVESVTTFFKWLGAATLTESLYSPDLFHNEIVVGSVTNYLVNPNNQRMRIYEPSYAGFDIDNVMGGPFSTQMICDGAGNNFRISNASGNSDYAASHLMIGTYHLWVDSTGDLRIKGSTPSGDTDGTVVGTQT